MIKRVTVYSLPKEIDPDTFFQYHTQVHAPDVIRIMGADLKRYVISRIRRVISGEQKFFALIELWWEDEQAMNRCTDKLRKTILPNGRTCWDDFWSQVTDGMVAVAEEHVMKG
jgi:uncharacterized protein (TIGR02118 family)